jgi:hypothetical protein
MLKCSFCVREYEFEHKPSGKMFCSRCWEKYCRNADRKFEQKMIEESGVGLFKYIKEEAKQ